MNLVLKIILLISICCIVLVLLLGFIIVFNPYFLVPSYYIEKYSSWGAFTDKQPGLIIFKIKSNGALTANYPIDLEVEIKKSKDIENYFLGTGKIDIKIGNAYEYPIVKRKTKEPIEIASIPISLKTGKGNGKIIFPDAGYFSTYFIFYNDKPVYWNRDTNESIPIFIIENYGLRLQIENNRSMGIAIISVSFAALGILISLKTRNTNQMPSEKTSLNNKKKTNKY